MTARAVTSSVNPRQRPGTSARHRCAAERRRRHSPALHLQRHRPAVHISSSSLPGRCPGLTESGSALRTSSSTLAAASPVIAHLRSALCGSCPASPCVLAALIRMGLLKIARLQRADIASSPPRAAVAEHDRASGHAIPHHRIAQQSRSMTAPSPRHITTDIRTYRRGATALCHNPVRGAQQSVPGLDTPLLSACRRYATTASIPTQHQRRAYGASQMRHCIITPSARRDSGGRMGHRRSTITRRFGDALLLQRRSMTARAVTSSVNPRQRRGHPHDADAPRSVAAGTLRHIYSKIVCICHIVSE